ncbi:hypothetical protein [Agromyces sp. CF514]|uniref:hypothetical protein n=1 Tax=Agromyces sp. CF514 TaxID=1881031 RepID=UPI0015A54573|nr:hypothetical protein [Agromyces sp. CF514]
MIGRWAPPTGSAPTTVRIVPWRLLDADEERALAASVAELGAFLDTGLRIDLEPASAG